LFDQNSSVGALPNTMLVIACQLAIGKGFWQCLLAVMINNCGVEYGSLWSVGPNQIS